MMKLIRMIPVLLTVVALTGAAAGQEKYDYTGTGSDWQTIGNWTNVVNEYDPNDPNAAAATVLPDASDYVYIRNANTVSVGSGTAYGRDVLVGGVRYTVGGTSTGGTIWRDQSTLVMTSSSALNITGGSVVGSGLQGGGRLVVGDAYAGKLIQDGGVIRTDRIDVGRERNVVYSDPNYNGTPVGTYIMNDGWVTATDVNLSQVYNNRKARMYVGQGVSGTSAGAGTFIMNGGLIGPSDPDPNNAGAYKLTLYVGYDPSTTGYAEQNAGSVVVDNLTVGGASSTGKYILNDGYLYCGDRPNSNGLDDIFTVNGGTLSTSGWQIGVNGTTSYTINNGVVEVRSGGLVVGSGRVYTGGSLQMGFGTLNINQTDPNKPTEFTLGGSGEGWIGYGSNTEKGYPGTAIPTVGIVTMTAGTFYSNSQAANGGLIIGNARQSVVEGNTLYNYNTGAAGTLNILGGSYIGGVSSSLILAAAPDTTGVLRVSKNAYFEMNGALIMRAGGTVDPNTSDFDDRRAVLAIEVGAGGNSLLNFGYLVTLADTLRVETGTYRPKQGDQCLVLNSSYIDPVNYNSYEGSFTTFASNITLGLPNDPNDPNQKLSAFTGWIDSVDTRLYYIAFQGYTNGDATGTGEVNSGDLSLLTGSWGATSGATWGGGDFTGEGAVNSGDLSLLTGSWGWVLPSPAPGAIPEPATLALLGLGGLTLIRRKR